MDEQRDTVDTAATTDTAVAQPAGPSPAPPVIVQTTESDHRGFSLGSFLIGVVTTLIAGAIAIGVFLVVSDSDDDGNLELDVPAVDVDIDG